MIWIERMKLTSLGRQARIIFGLFRKEKCEIQRNKRFLLLIFMMPAIAFIVRGMASEQMAAFIPLATAIQVVMVPIVCTANIIAEEKEKNTLKMLLLSDVKLGAYIAGIGIAVEIFTILGLMFIAMNTDYNDIVSAYYILYGALVSIISYILGAMIGLGVKNQVSVGPAIMPVIMITLALPAIGEFNEFLHGIAELLYSNAFNQMVVSMEYTMHYQMIIWMNFIIVVVVFLIRWRRDKLLLE